MKIKEYLKLTYSKSAVGYVDVRPRVCCKDGYSISIQADSNKYCKPRRDLRSGNYETVELGFPNIEDDIINSYSEYSCGRTETIYPYVPIDIVDALIEKHGGIDFEKMFINTFNICK